MKPNMVLFSHIHKSGGTTLKWIMRNSFGLRHLEVEPLHSQAAFPDTAVYHPNGVIDQAKSSLKPIDAQGLARISKGFPHVMSLQSHNLSPAQDLGDHRWFTYLRDPRKQVASWFQYLIEIGKRTDLEFFSYMKTEFAHERQCKMLSGQPDFASAARVIRDRNVFCGFVEDFDRSLLLLKHVQIPELRPAYIEAYGSTLDADLVAFRASKGSFNTRRLNLSRIQSRLVYERFWMPRKRRRDATGKGAA